VLGSLKLYALAFILFACPAFAANTTAVCKAGCKSQLKPKCEQACREHAKKAPDKCIKEMCEMAMKQCDQMCEKEQPKRGK